MADITVGPGRAFPRGMALTLLTTPHLGRTLLSRGREMEGDKRNPISWLLTETCLHQLLGKLGEGVGIRRGIVCF